MGVSWKVPFRLLYCASGGIRGGAEDPTGHWDMMKGDLPYFLNGMDLAVRAGEVEPTTGRQG